MEKEKLYMNEETLFAMEMTGSSNEIPNCFFNTNWNNSLDQSDPFESALSSIVSSPNSIPNSTNNFNDPFIIRELIGKLGNICNSPQSFNNNNNSTNNSCFTTPLNSPPKLSINNNVQIPTLAPLPADPEFVERAAKFSCFGQFVNSAQKGCKNSVSGSENGDSREGSSLSELIPSEELNVKVQSNGNERNKDCNGRKRKGIPKGKAKETPASSASVSDLKVAEKKDESYAKRTKSDDGNGNDKVKEEQNENNKQNKDGQKPPEPPKDYIHVRARRGQATDSHSLAERVRREKISERMKFLQDLVPGCNKVTGKAVMLDEIINYVQSLQRQVEFLSMKLATVNPTMDINLEAVLPKDSYQSRGSLPHGLYPFDPSAALALPYGYQSQQGVHLPNGMSNNMEAQFSMNPLTTMLRRNQSAQLPSLDGFGDAAPSCQVSALWGDDLQSVVQMGFLQNQQQCFPIPTGSSPGAQMKVEQ